MTRFLSSLLVVVCLLTFGIANVYAYPHGSKDKKKDLESKFYKKAYMCLENADALGLSDDQIEELKNLKHETKKDVIQKNADIEILGLDARHLLYQDEVDLDALNSIIDQKYDVKKAKAKVLVKAIAELKGLLSENQMDSLKAIYKGAKKNYCAKCALKSKK